MSRLFAYLRWISSVAVVSVAVLGAVLTGTIQRASAAPGPIHPRKHQGPLSPRLAQLATPAVQGASLNQLASELSVAETGPGSLLTRGPGRVLVDVQLASPTPSQMQALAGTGAKVIAHTDDATLVTLDVAFTQLDAVAAVPGVKWVQEILTPMTSRRGGSTPPPGPVANSTCPSGIAISEANTQLNVDTARTTFGVDGAGVRVGVLSDSFATKVAPATTAAQDVVNGDLPGAANTCGNITPVTVQSEKSAPAGGDEGRGMLQLVHDLAPGAPLSFASAFNGEGDFATQIRNLQTNGAKVIVDDVTYFDEPMYQDGIVAKAVQDVTDLGVPYFSSAANNNLFVGGKSVGSYEAQGGYRPMACPAAVVATGEADCHDFDPGIGSSDGDLLTMPAGKTLKMALSWNQPQSGITTDLDLFLVDTVTGAVAAQAANDNLISQTASEVMSFTNSTGVTRDFKLVVGRFAGAAAPRFKFVFLTNGGAPFTAVQWNTSSGTDVIGPTTFGHNAKINAGSIAAVPFNNSATPENFSSRGPAVYCFGPVVGVTPAAALGGGCQTKQLDVAATDGAATSFFAQLIAGTWRFFGTSAAAPHAAAIAALQLEAEPCRTPAEVLAAQRASGRAVGAFTQADVGSGLVDAVTAIGGLASCPPTFPAIAPITVNEGDAVTVNFPGAASQPSGHALTYAFTQTSGPSVLFIQNSATTQRRFIAPRTTANAPMTLTFNAVVTDTVNTTTTTRSVTVTVNNITPTASISAPKVVTAGSGVVLKGASNDQIEPDIAPSGTTGRQYIYAKTAGPAVVLTPGSGAGFRQATFTPVTAGLYTFSLVVTDHGGTGAASAPATITIDVRAAPAAGTLNGIVTDSAGATLSGAAVNVFSISTGGANVGSTVSGVNGAWTVSGLSPGVNYFVRFTKATYGTRWNFDGFNTAFVRPVSAPSATADASLTLTPRTITGTVTNSASAGVVGVVVRLLDDTGLLDSTTTVGGGAYSFSGLSPKGTHRIQIAPSDATFAPAWVTSDGRGAASGATGLPNLLVNTTGANAVAATTVVFNKSTELRTLTVNVHDGASAPITGVEVRLYNPGWVGSQRSNVAGVYTMAGVRPAATYQVWVWTKCSGCTSTAFTSQWATGIPGEQYDQSAKLAPNVDITANQSVSFTLS